MEGTAAVILAAGIGKRFKSPLPKVLHRIYGKPIVGYVLDLLESMEVQKRIMVVAPDIEKFREIFGERVGYVVQDRPLGTGHAALQAEEALSDFKGKVIVINGDTPLWEAETIEGLIGVHRKKNASATIVTALYDRPPAYGRIIRDERERVIQIVEERDCSPEQKEIKEVNVGLYCFDRDVLFKELKKVSSDNDQNEYYITDVIGLASRDGLRVEAFPVQDKNQCLGINDRKQLSIARKILNERTLDRLMLEYGVTILDPLSTFIHPDVEIGSDSIIYPFTIIEGDTFIGKSCIIGPGSHIVDSEIEAGAKVVSSSIHNSKVKSGEVIGPFAVLSSD